MRPIIVIGDSLACPRPHEGVGLQQTYAYKLQEKLGPRYYVVNLSAGENNSRKINSAGFQRTFIRSSNAEIVIIQIGIVDCAPRLMSLIERFIGGIAARISWLSPIFTAYARLKSRYRYRLTRLFPRTLVGRGEYVSNMERFITELERLETLRRIYIIDIADVTDALASKSYGIRENIRLFNGALIELASRIPSRVTVIGLNEATSVHPHWITEEDGHHIRAAAHDWIADRIASDIERRGIY